MATLTNTKIKDTYVGLLKTTDNQAIDASGVTLVEDGAGNASALSVGRSGNGVTITGGLNATLATAAQPNITSVGTLSSLAVSGNLTVDTNTLYVESINNRVGIGTSSVGAKLDISNSTSDPTLKLKSTNNTLYVTSKVYNDSDKGLDTLVYGSAYSGGSVLSVGANGLAMFSNTTTALTTLGAFDLRFGTNGSERMRIDLSGNVGIGTSSPTSDVHLQRNVNGDVDLRIQNANAGSAATATLNVDALGNNFRIINYPDADTGNANRTDLGSTAGGSYLTFSTAAIERMRILSSGGITFNGDTAADNALDDYEEGTWTPTYTTADGDFDTIDYGTQTGRYTKIGRVVYCDLMLRAGNITYSGAVTAGSDVRISGLPFSVIGGFAIAGGSIAFINNWGNTNNPNSISVQTGTGGIALNKLSDTASRYAVSVSDLDTGAANSRNDIRMSFFYFV